MSAAASRRALLGGLAALPALTVPAIASTAPSSEIAKLCDFAIAHSKWIDAACLAEGDWPEERMTLELKRYWNAFEAVNNQASVSLAEARAKARLALHDMENSGALNNADPCIVLAANVLEEIIALCA